MSLSIPRVRKWTFLPWLGGSPWEKVTFLPWLKKKAYRIEWKSGGIQWKCGGWECQRKYQEKKWNIPCNPIMEVEHIMSQKKRKKCERQRIGMDAKYNDIGHVVYSCFQRTLQKRA